MARVLLGFGHDWFGCMHGLHRWPTAQAVCSVWDRHTLIQILASTARERTHTRIVLNILVKMIHFNLKTTKTSIYTIIILFRQETKQPICYQVGYVYFSVSRNVKKIASRPRSFEGGKEGAVLTPTPPPLNPLVHVSYTTCCVSSARQCSFFITIRY